MRSLLLDTNVVLWLMLGERARIPPRVVKLLEDPTVPAAVSSATVWEIAIKRSLSKLMLEDRWLAALGRIGFASLPITALHAAAVEQLPWHHRDPFDRILVAQAASENMALVTADGQLAAYGVDVVW